MVFWRKDQSVENPTNPAAEAERVLIIKLSALGDFVLSLGAMKAVRDFHPSAQITLLTTPPFKDFATLCPYVDIVETDGRPENVKLTGALIQRLRKAKYDIIYDFQTSGRTKNYFTALSKGGKAPLWSGHHEKSAFFHADPDRATMHSIDRLNEQLAFAGLAPGRWKKSEAPFPDLTWVRPLLNNPPSLQPAYFSLDEPFALLIPGASAHRTAKCWPSDRYGALARRFVDRGVMPVIIGGKAEGEIAREITKLEPRCKSIVTRTNFFQIVGLAERACVAVGNDTGPMHMATLAGAPGVALFALSESNPSHAAPRGKREVIVKTADVLKNLDVDDVWDSVCSLDVLPAA